MGQPALTQSRAEDSSKACAQDGASVPSEREGPEGPTVDCHLLEEVTPALPAGTSVPQGQGRTSQVLAAPLLISMDLQSFCTFL